MKQFLYIVALLIAFLFSFNDANTAYGQRMARESPWQEADKTGKYYMERCEKCGVWITGTSETFKNQAMDEHMRIIHPEGVDNSNDENDENHNGNNNSNNDANISDAIVVIDIYQAAYALADIGVCMADDFVSFYKITSNSFVWNKNTITLSEFRSYVSRYYTKATEITDIDMIPEECKVAVLSKSPTFCIQTNDGRKLLYYQISTEIRRNINRSSCVSCFVNYETMYTL